MTFTELVAAAAVGTAQRPVPTPSPDLLPPFEEDSPAVGLLDAASAYAVVRRAHLPYEPEVTPVEPAPPDPRPIPPDRFVSALTRLLGQFTDEQRPLPVPLLTELVVEALGWMGQVGWRLPERLLVTVLQRATYDARLGLAAVDALGDAGRWLAALNPAWSPLVDGTAAKPPTYDSAWHEGDAAARLAHLTALRSRDPDAARELLAEGWSKEAVDDRVRFAQVIASTAGPNDESFLVAALKDRSARVVEVARPGLLRIPTSALAQRLRHRVTVCVTVRREGLGRTVLLTPPDDDPTAVADGLTGGAYSRTPAENRLNALVASIDPKEWPALVGVHAIELLRAKTDQSWSVVKGLVEAAVTFADTSLADDLVVAGVVTPQLLGLLGQHRMARLLSAPGAPMAAEVVLGLADSWSRPWSSALSQAVSDWLQGQLAGGPATARTIPAPLLALAATAVPVPVARGWAQRLRTLTMDQRIGPGVQRVARHAAAALTLRAAMYDDVRAALDAGSVPPHAPPPPDPYQQENR